MSAGPRSVVSIGLLAALCCSLLPARARAEPVLAVDLDVAVPVEVAYAAVGGGVGARLSDRAVVGPLTWQPELGFSFAAFGTARDNLARSGPQLYRGVVGARVSVGSGKQLRPGLSAHLGLGHLRAETLSAPTGDVGTSAQTSSGTELSWDAGAFVELEVAGPLSLGLHAVFAQIIAGVQEQPFDWCELGAHAALTL